LPQIDLDAGTPRAGVATVASANGYNEQLGHLFGAGSLLVYNSWRSSAGGAVGAQRLLRIGRDRTARLLASGPDAGPIIAVDERRIVVVRPGHRVALLDREGKPVNQFAVGTAPVVAARLDGSKLVLQRGPQLEVYDSADGRLEHSWRTAASLSSVRLEGAAGDYAVYTAGIAIHLLRLSTGSDRVLAIPQEAQPAHAALERDGLYYSYNRQGASSDPGRLAFVPTRELRALR
jgi:hypothetical protein